MLRSVVVQMLKWSKRSDSLGKRLGKAKGWRDMTNAHKTMLAAAAAAAFGLCSLVGADGAHAVQAPSGDASRGQKVMEARGCFDCHRIGDRGSRVGPNLSDVGGRRTAELLRQALIAPDDEVLPENRSVRVVTADGSSMTGRLLNQDAISVQMITPKDELKTYMRTGLREFTILDKGLMPSVQGKMSDAEIADLVSYLASLKSN